MNKGGSSRVNPAAIAEECNKELPEPEDVSYAEDNLWSWLCRWSRSVWELKICGMENQYSELKRRLVEKLSSAYTRDQNKLQGDVNRYLGDVLDALKSLGYTSLDS